MNKTLITSLMRRFDEIWDKPPIYFRVWFFLNCMAYGSDKPAKIQDGVCITTIRAIAANVAWFERGILKVPNPGTIEKVLSYLEDSGFIFRKNTRRHTKITIL